MLCLAIDVRNILVRTLVKTTLNYSEILHPLFRPHPDYPFAEQVATGYCAAREVFWDAPEERDSRGASAAIRRYRCKEEKFRDHGSAGTSQQLHYCLSR